MKREELKRYTSSDIEEIDDTLLEASEDGTIKMTRAYITSEADSVMDEYEARIKHLEEILDSDPRTNLRLVNENQQLRARINDLESQLENVQNTMATENVDANMALVKANERIKELECDNARLKAKVPEWISVKDRLPSNQERVFGLVVGTDLVTKDWTPELNERIKRTELCYYVDGDGWYSSDGYQMVVSPRMWMSLPLPPTTEESSATEKGNG